MTPPYGPPAMRGDGRNMLRPYGLARTYPCQGTRRGCSRLDCGLRRNDELVSPSS